MPIFSGVRFNGLIRVRGGEMDFGWIKFGISSLISVGGVLGGVNDVTYIGDSGDECKLNFTFRAFFFSIHVIWFNSIRSFSVCFGCVVCVSKFIFTFFCSVFGRVCFFVAVFSFVSFNIASDLIIIELVNSILNDPVFVVINYDISPGVGCWTSGETAFGIIKLAFGNTVSSSSPNCNSSCYY